MANIAVAVGHEWSQNALCDGWGPDATDEHVVMLADAVAQRFEELASAAGHPEIYWTPHTSDVLGEYGIDVDEDKLHQWREEATQEEIVDYMKNRMAAYKCPRVIHFENVLPKGATGRILRDKIKHQITEN